MKRAASKVYDEYQELSSQSKNPSEYCILKHEANELPAIPVDANLLLFEDKSIQDRYFKALYVDERTLLISKEFRYNLMNFYVFISLFLANNLVLSLLLYQYSKIKWQFFLLHIISTGTILLFSYVFLYLIMRNKKVLRYNKAGFLVVGLATYLYLILGASEVFQGFSGASSDCHLFPTLIEIVGFTYAYRRVLFDSFKYFTFTIIPVLLIYISINLIFSNQYIYSTLSEIGSIALFLITQLIETHSVEHRTLQIFYRMEKEEMRYESLTKKKKGHSTKSLVGSLESKFQFVIDELKYAISAIIFKEVKERLKQARSELIVIKNKIDQLTDTQSYEISTKDMDEDEKEFILQNYYKASNFASQPLPRNRVHKQHSPTKQLLTRTLLISIQEFLSNIGQDWNINPFYIHEQTGKPISTTSLFIYNQHGLGFSLRCSEDSFISFFTSLENTYKHNPYHNSIHGADVFLSLYYFYINSSISSPSSALDLTCILISALGHDAGHPGVTNRFLITSRDKIALQYNDISVLENMHSSLIFSILAEEENDFLSELNEDDWANCRRIVISMILETDLSKHFEVCAKFRAKTCLGEKLEIASIEDKILILGMGLKCADIGHSAKSRELHLKWSGLVTEEFFRQGDVEKEQGILVSMYCDRGNTDVSKSQAGFIRNICVPLFELWCGYLKSEKIEVCLKTLRENYSYWENDYKARKWTTVKLISTSN